MDLAIRLLGPVELIRDGTVVAAGGPTQHAVLAMLALHAGQPVDIDTLVDGIWGESDERPGGRSTIWPHVSRIRTALRGSGHPPIITVGGGYRLDPEVVAIDAREFERLLELGRRQLADGDARAASTSLDEALALWRGPALMGLRDFPFAAAFATRYDELRIDATEERIEACLALGETRSLIPELHALVAEHPYRERLHGQLMLTLYRDGQQAAALDAFAAARNRMVLDLGAEPGPELEHLHQQILEHADTLALPAGATSGAVSRHLAPARGLPRSPDLIGREDQLRELERLADVEHLVTLTGTGGSGKTVLALALAHRLLPRFTDGATFVDLAAVSRPEQVLPAIAAALGVSPRAGPLDAQLAEHLADRRMIVVLDNVEHVLEAVPDLALIVDATAGLLIATSRSPLGLRAEHVVDVPPLPVPATDDPTDRIAGSPAVQLFLRVAEGAGGAIAETDDELVAAARICRLVDGLPLAIEITATRTRVEGVGELAAHLTERLPTLRARSRDIPQRQQTMDAAIGWSINRLGAGQDLHLAQLAVFAGSFSVAGAAAVCGLSRERATELIADLLDVSLLTRQPPVAGQARFRILEPVRAVARARAEQSRLAEAARLHAAFMQAEIDRLCPRGIGIRSPDDLAELRLEHHDLMLALGRLSGSDADRCVGLVHQLDDYWAWTGREAEAKRVVDDALAQASLTDPAASVALILSAHGAFLLGRLEDAHRAIDRALTRSRRVADPATRAFVRFYDARFGMWSGDRRRARVASHAAVRYARQAGDLRLLAISLGLEALSNPNSPKGDAQLEEALGIARAQSMAFTEVWVLSFHSLYLGRRAPSEAVPIERRVLDIARRYQASAAVGGPIVGNLGWSLIRSGAVDEARPLLLSRLVLADQAGHRVWATGVVSVLGLAEAAVGRWAEARVLMTASEAISRRTGLTALTTGEEVDEIAETLLTVDAHLGPEAAAAAAARGEAMGYREAVDYALEVNGLRGRSPAT